MCPEHGGAEGMLLLRTDCRDFYFNIKKRVFHIRVEKIGFVEDLFRGMMEYW